MSVPTLLELAGVHTHIGAYHILHGVDFEVPAGEVTMLLGRNGAGKTTTLRTIMGLWAASQGSIAFDGQQIGGPAATPGGAAPAQLLTPAIAALGIAYVPENMGIFADLSVAENMLLAARSARHHDQLDTARLEWLFGLFPALKKFWLYPAGKLSGGQKQMLAIARAMVEPRRLLLIDEPSKGLAPAIVLNLIRAARPQAHRDDGAPRRAELPGRACARRPRRGDGGRPRRPSRHDGRARRRRGAAAAAARPLARRASIAATWRRPA